jgi:hypothetical protein
LIDRRKERKEEERKKKKRGTHAFSLSLYTHM